MQNLKIFDEKCLLRNAGENSRLMKTSFFKCHQTFLVLVITMMSSNSFAKDGYYLPVSVNKNIVTFTVNKDGSYKVVKETSLLIENEDGATNYGEKKIEYSPKYESIKILDAYTILPNGAHLKVPAKNIRDVKGDMDSQSGSYSDTQYKVIIYPNVVVGGKIYFKYMLVRHSPLFPGQFTNMETMSPNLKISNWEMNFNFDKGINVKVESKGVVGGKLPDKDGIHRYHFTFKQENTMPMEDGQIATGDYSPYVQASTFSNYGALGKAFQNKAQKKMKITPAIQKMADSLTAGVTDKKQQANILYNWVRKNIRYVGSYIGNGGYVPHDAQSILNNRWGDCKDHVVILGVLLAAKGIVSSPALINADDSYVLPPLPVISAFNHVITYIPEFDLYLDSTSQFVRFGSLPRSDLNKSVVLTALGKVGKTPPMLAVDNQADTSIALKVLPDGSINGTSHTVVTGTEDMYLRYDVFNNQSTPKVNVVNDRLRRANLSGVGEINAGDPFNIDKPFEINTKFTLDPVSNIPGPAAMPIPAGLAYEVIRAGLMAKPKVKQNFPGLCTSFTYKNEYLIQFPAGLKITHIPDNVKYNDGGVKYTATYKLSGEYLKISRDLVQQFPSMVCGEAENEKDKKFFPVFERDMRAQVIYE